MTDGERRGSGRPDKLRRRIVAEAARDVVAGGDAKRAVFRAARRIAGGRVPSVDLPGFDEVRAGAQARLDPRGAAVDGDRLTRIAGLVGLLATVRLDPAVHAARDALEHTLQVFALVHAERPYDEELLTAALVHDVGLVFDRGDPRNSTLQVVADLVTPRTRWLIESLDDARAHVEQTLGHRARRRLENHPDFLDALVLADAVRKGRLAGAPEWSLDEAVVVLRELDRDDDGG